MSVMRHASHRRRSGSKRTVPLRALATFGSRVVGSIAGAIMYGRAGVGSNRLGGVGSGKTAVGNAMATAIAGVKGAGASNVRMPAAGSLRQATLCVTKMENRDITGDSCANGGRETDASLEPKLVPGIKGSMMRSAKTPTRPSSNNIRTDQWEFGGACSVRRYSKRS